MLSTPKVKRNLYHTRKITCQGYKREDGLFDIEGHLLDSKTFDIDNRDRGGVIATGDAIHEMQLRITLDLTFNIKDAEAHIIWSPFHICKEGSFNFKDIIGLTIQSGWRSQVNRCIGNTAGCTHITELLGAVATTAFQTMVQDLKIFDEDSQDDKPPILLNSCHAFSETSAVVLRQWPKWHK